MVFELDFINYLNDCLRDPEFKYYWDLSDSYSIAEVLKELLEQELRMKKLPNNIKFFKLENGSCPVRDFIESIQDKKLKAKVLRDIEILAVEGRKIRMPLSKYVRDGFYELRTKQSSNITRIFYFFAVGDFIILTNGYIKKDTKLDNKELQKAKKYRDIYSKNYEKELNKE